MRPRHTSSLRFRPFCAGVSVDNRHVRYKAIAAFWKSLDESRILSRRPIEVSSKNERMFSEQAAEVQKVLVVAVTDAHGELIAFARMDGAPPSVTIAVNKAWTAARTGKPTQEIGEKVRDPQRGHDIAFYGDPRFVAWGGGVPVYHGGDVVGAVAVSRLSSKEDSRLASSGADLIIRT